MPSAVGVYRPIISGFGNRGITIPSAKSCSTNCTGVLVLGRSAAPSAE